MAEKDPSEYVKRAPTLATTAAYGYTAGVAVQTIHWFVKCFKSGHFVIEPPEDALIESWAFLLLPTVHLGVKIFNAWLQNKADKLGVDK